MLGTCHKTAHQSVRYVVPGGVDEAMLNQIMQSLMKGVEDYTVDSRGDIGAIVRESAMCSLQVQSCSLSVH